MLELFSYTLSYSQLGMLFLVALFIGMAKTGVHGIGMFAVPILALIFGGKVSAGLMLPMMIMADLFAVKAYHRHANWQYLIKLFPTAVLGVLLGTWLGNHIDDQAFQLMMSVIVLVSLGIMLWMEGTNKELIPDNIWFACLMGLLGGVATMIGNLAGPIMALYLLSMRLPKNEYIGTTAWFFLILNISKVPFHVFSWQTISLDSFSLNLLCLPFIAVGAFCGVWVVKCIAEKLYRWLVIGMTAVAALFLLF